ncbi:MAG TPA: dockerin type I domain-containing protein [Acetivibrio sp.]|nr:dockerin type I domain-containing protein [Acetivibrio sp.]
MKIKVKETFFVLVLIAVVFCNTVYSNASENMLEYRTIDDIVECYQRNPFRINVSVSDPYEIEPNAEPPYVAGSLKREYLEEALNCVNFLRYLVGLPDDIELNDTYNNYAQHATIVFERLKQLTHYPKKPDDMPDDFYSLAYNGASNSNIAYGYASLMNSIMGYMKDEDDSNISIVGHRRWLLNPSMTKIGFGQCGIFYSAYVADMSRSPSIKFDFISWPARNNMPREYFYNSNIPWSVNLGSNYANPSLDDVEVTLTRRSDNKVWIFNKNNIEEYGYFNVNNDGYGMKKCIIFRPNGVGSYYKNDVFDVNIKGIRHYTDGPTEINYTVEFFSLTDAIDEREKNFKYGDVNGDGDIDSLDLTILKRYLLRKMDISDDRPADLDGDGDINSTDLTLLKRYILRKIDRFPVET